MAVGVEPSTDDEATPFPPYPRGKFLPSEGRDRDSPHDGRLCMDLNVRVFLDSHSEAARGGIREARFKSLGGRGLGRSDLPTATSVD